MQQLALDRPGLSKIVRSSHVVTDDDGYCSHRGSRRRVPAFGD
jgi:hypothetical protein